MFVFMGLNNSREEGDEGLEQGEWNEKLRSSKVTNLPVFYEVAGKIEVKFWSLIELL